MEPTPPTTMEPTPTTIQADGSWIQAARPSEILEDDVARLEAENAEMEEKLQLDKRVSFITSPKPVLDATTPGRSTEAAPSTPTSEVGVHTEVSTPPAEVCSAGVGRCGPIPCGVR